MKKKTSIIQNVDAQKVCELTSVGMTLTGFVGGMAIGVGLSGDTASGALLGGVSGTLLGAVGGAFVGLKAHETIKTAQKEIKEGV